MTQNIVFSLVHFNFLQNLFARTEAGHTMKVSYRVEARYRMLYMYFLYSDQSTMNVSKHNCSYMEIYNENVHDLLVTNISSTHQHNLKVREHPKDGPYVESMCYCSSQLHSFILLILLCQLSIDLTKHLVSNYDAIHTLIKKGNSYR